MSFLLVDDEPQLRQALARSLSARGHTVQQAANHREAVAAALSGTYDLLFLDINLPDATGWDVLRDIHAAGKHIPTVVFSAVTPSVRRIREFGPIGVLTKPFPIESLLRYVTTVQEAKRA